MWFLLTNYVAQNFAGSNSSVIHQKVPQKNITAKNFAANIYSTVDILMVDTDYRIESDFEDEEELYRLEDESGIDNPLDNAPSCSVGIVDPSPEQSVTCYCNIMTMISAICFTWPYCFKISKNMYFDCPSSIKNKDVINTSQHDFLKIKKKN